jgi:tetratricopeptide (TPR) repeat protein
MAYLNKSNTLYDLGRREEALAFFEHAIRLDPMFSIAYNNKDIVLKKPGRKREAAQAFQKTNSLVHSQQRR